MELIQSGPSSAYAADVQTVSRISKIAKAYGAGRYVANTGGSMIYCEAPCIILGGLIYWVASGAENVTVALWNAAGGVALRTLTRSLSVTGLYSFQFASSYSALVDAKLVIGMWNASGGLNTRFTAFGTAANVGVVNTNQAGFKQGPLWVDPIWEGTTGNAPSSRSISSPASKYGVDPWVAPFNPSTEGYS